jgi:hypothetical protein
MDFSVGNDMQNEAEAPGDLIHAIGDDHGRSDLLRTLLGLIERDADRRGRAATIVFTCDFRAIVNDELLRATLRERTRGRPGEPLPALPQGRSRGRCVRAGTRRARPG